MISKIAKFMSEHPSSIREIMELVAEFENHPEKFPQPLIYLAGGWPQDPPPSFIRDIFSEIITDENLWRRGARYSPTMGYPDLTESIAIYESYIFQRKIDPENIAVGLGSTEQTAALFRLLLDPGDEVILTRPGYLNYTRQVSLELSNSVKIKYWNVIDNYTFKPSIDKLQDLITNKTKIILITSPGNPDGQVWDDAILKAINDLAEEKEFYVIIDSAYRAFIFSGDRTPFKRRPLAREIWICTFSKELRAPGWRVSYVVLPPELKQPFNTIEQAKVLAPVSLIQIALTKAFNNKEFLRKLMEFYESGAKRYKQLADETVSELNTIRDIHVLEPKGGFYVFFDVSKFSEDDKKIWRDLINKKQLALAPGSDFNGAKGWLRLSFAPVVETPEKLREGIQRLKEYFAELGSTS